MHPQADQPRDPATPVTIYEVAQRAGVSIATVSHALNRPERVAEATRARVLDTAAALGFAPRGRGRAVPALRRIAVAGPFRAHATYLARLVGLLEDADGIDVIVLDTTGEDPAPVLDALPLRGPVDGVILMGCTPTSRLAAELGATPVVLLDARAAHLPSVTIDDAIGGALLAAHLLECGARRFAAVSAAPPGDEHVTNGELRLRGFTDALRAAGQDADVPWTICEDSFEGGRDAGRRLAARLPDAVFALHDEIAAGLLAGLRDEGVRVPGDVLVAGYDDIPLAQALDLTTIRQPFAHSGRAALGLLRDACARPGTPLAHTALVPELIVRATTTRKDSA